LFYFKLKNEEKIESFLGAFTNCVGKNSYSFHRFFLIRTLLLSLLRNLDQISGIPPLSHRHNPKNQYFQKREEFFGVIRSRKAKAV